MLCLREPRSGRLTGRFGLGPDVAAVRAAMDRADHDALLMVDEAHGLGVLGTSGRGVAEAAGVNPRAVDLWMGTLSKSLASCGGYIAGSSKFIDVIRSFAPGFIFTTSIPPVLTAGALASVRHLKSSQAERQRHQERHPG